MKVIFMGKDKEFTIKGLQYLLDLNIEVVAVICDKNNESVNSLRNISEMNNIEIFDNDEMYENIKNGYWKDVDLVISYLYWRLIKKPLIDLAKLGCINFHPAPLPEYRGLGGYNFAILDQIDYWGASVHYVDEQIDTGNIIEVRKFSIDKDTITAFELEKMTQIEMFELFKTTIDKYIAGETLEGYPQSEGLYINREMFERAKKISLESDTPEMIKRKIRAFWFPPYEGAYIEIGGEKVTLVDNNILKNLNK